MKTNEFPHYDESVNTTGCCPRFNQDGWDGQDLHFKDKRFVRATTRSAMHIPLNMGSVFSRVQSEIEAANAYGADGHVVLSRDLSPWQAEHLFAASHDVPGEEMTQLSGDFVTKVFDGPFSQSKIWCDEMDRLVREKGKEPKRTYFFYTTCPKCAKAYGHNLVVGVAEI
ncbi:MAG: hydrolase [Rhizobiaceae bacterium]